MTAGRWVAYDRDAPVVIGRPGHSQEHVRRAALDDYGVPAADLRIEWRPDKEES